MLNFSTVVVLYIKGFTMMKALQEWVLDKKKVNVQSRDRYSTTGGHINIA